MSEHTTGSILSDRAFITAASAVALWMLTQWFELVTNWVRTRKAQKNLIRSLFAEVDFNTRDLEFFVRNSADMSAIEARLLEDKRYLPHITDAHHTIIYTANIENLHHLNNALAARLVLFYGLLDKIKAQIDGINLASFAAVSAAGKLTVVKRVTENVKECQTEGENILREFSKTYSKLGLTRHVRRLVDTKQK